MKRPVLILISDSYPYKGGDGVFLKDEIAVIAERFGEIHIFPMAGKGNPEGFPSNIQVHEEVRSVLARAKKPNLETVRLYIDALCGKSIWNDLVKVGAKSFLWTFGRTLHWAMKANVIEREVGNLLAVLEDSDVLMYSFWFNAPTFGMGRLRRRYPNTRLITRAHGTDLYFNRQPGNRFPFRKETLSCLDGVFLATSEAVAYMQMNFPEYFEVFHAAPLGTMDYMSSVSDGRPIELPSPERYRIVSCSSVLALKRVDMIIDALSHLENSRNIEIEWMHFGAGRRLDELRAYASTKLQKTMWRMPGHVDKEKILAYYYENPVDCFVTASSSEGGRPVSIMESLCFGIPVVATAVGGIPELVDPAVGALLPENTSAGIFGEAIADILIRSRNIELRRACRERWEERCQAKLNYSDFADSILNLFTKRE